MNNSLSGHKFHFVVTQKYDKGSLRHHNSEKTGKMLCTVFVSDGQGTMHAYIHTFLYTWGQFNLAIPPGTFLGRLEETREPDGNPHGSWENM